jgi:aminoglycoside 6-adenylyltransferase
MRIHDEMMKLILDRAKNDERIRAVYMQGSRIDPNATHDKYSDYDIVFIVRDIRSFTNNEKWIDYFGERLILQKPDDWYSHPYDYNSNHKFAYLIQFKDGNRIDLTLIDMENLQDVLNDTEPRKILLAKDGIQDLYDINVDNYYNIKSLQRKSILTAAMNSGG